MSDRANALLVRWDGGWMERTNGGDPRIEAKLATGSLHSLQEAQAVADAALAVNHRQQQFDLAMDTDETAQLPYLTWHVGDTVDVESYLDVPGPTAPVARRTGQVTVGEVDDTGLSVVTPSFVPPASSPSQPLILPGDIAAFQAAKKMADGTLRGQSRSAQPFVKARDRRPAVVVQPANPCLSGIGPLTLLHTEHAHNGNEIIYTIPDFILFDQGDGCGPQPVTPSLIRIVAGGMATGSLVAESTAFGPPGTVGLFPYYDDTHSFDADPGWSAPAVIAADFGIGDLMGLGDEIEAFTNNGTDIFGDHYVGYGMWGGHASTGLSGDIGGGGSAIVTLDMPFGFSGSDWPVTNDPILAGGDESFNLLMVAGGAGGYGGDDVAFGLTTRARAYPLGGQAGLPGGAASTGIADGSAHGGGGAGAGSGGGASNTATAGGYFTAGAGANDNAPGVGHFSGQAGGGGAGHYGGGGGDTDLQYGAGGGGGSSFVNPRGTLVGASHVMWPDEEALQPGVFTNRGPNFSYVWVYVYGYPGL